KFDFIHPTGLWTMDDCGLEVGQEACDIGSLRVICKGDERCSTISRCPCGQPIGRRAREQDRDECRLDEDKQNHGKSGPLRAKGWMDPEELAKLCEAAMAARRGAPRQGGHQTNAHAPAGPTPGPRGPPGLFPLRPNPIEYAPGHR